ncbi:MAG TPA: Yip1 family protein [Candidatus Kapabacteria bacterium]|jgi:hypothetical protein|nr:Yip1 family protein [Candidatus Kapabacteria bacterium]
MGLVDRAKNILLKPNEEWQVIAAEEPNAGAIITGYVIPLAILSAVAGAIGSFLLMSSAGMAIATAVFGLISAVISVLVASAVVNALAPTFNSEQNFGRAVQLVAYSYTAGLVGGILQIIPVAGSILAFLVGLYGIYLMYLGLPVVMKTPDDKRIVYMIIAFVALFLVGMILAMIFGALMITMGLGFAGAAGAFGS